MEHTKNCIHTARIVAALLFLTAYLSAQEDVTPSAQLQIAADRVEYGVDSAMARGEGAVEIVYGDLRLTCDKASINQKTMNFSAHGNVEVTMAGKGSWKADALHGNLASKAIEFGPFRLDTEVWHAGGDSGDTLADGSQHLSEGWMSTCDRSSPHYRIQAREIRYNPDSKTFVAKHATVRVGDIPVFYFPYLAGSTDNSAGLIIRPGYSGSKGGYLRLGRVWQHGDAGDTQVFVDGMTKRGIGLGEKTEYHTEGRDVVTNLYAIHDLDPAETERHYDRRFDSQDDRFRLKLYWREDVTSQLTLRINADLLSDISMLDDWFRRDWRHWGQPKSFASADYDGGWFHAGLQARPRLNSFYTVGESLPEATFDIPRMPLLDLPLVYSSHSSAGNYTMKWRDFDRPRSALINPDDFDSRIHGDPSDYRAFRADTLHTIQAPLDLGDIITITPRASIRATAYSRSSSRRITEKNLADWIDADNPDNPDGESPVEGRYDSRGGSRVRIATEVGIEGRSRLMGDWSEYENDFLNVKALRHVVEPYFNYTYAGAPTVDRDRLYFFDEIDRLQRQNFLRLGIEQRLLARDDKGEARTLLSLENYLDVHHDEGVETGRHWGDFGTRLTFHPRPDLKLWSTLLYDIGAGDIQRGEAGVRFGSEEWWNFRLKYVYRNDHLSRSVYSMGSSLADFTGESSYLKRHFRKADTLSAQVNIPLNSITSLEIGAEYDFEKNKLEEHHYYLTRQLHCWTLSTGFAWDDNDFEFMVFLRLVAFPNVKLDLNI